VPVPSFDVDGFLPPGRYRATVDEVHARFVGPYPKGHQRQQIWGDWPTVTGLLRQTVAEVAAAWLGGSFLSTKDQPNDLDCLYVVSVDKMTQLSPVQAKTLEQLTDPSPQGFRSKYGLQIDPYLLAWQLNPQSGPRNSQDVTYCQWRGYWDDFWQRRRSGGKMGLPKPEDGLPRRGYVEVILDDYHV